MVKHFPKTFASAEKSQTTTTSSRRCTACYLTFSAQPTTRSKPRRNTMNHKSDSLHFAFCDTHYFMFDQEVEKNGFQWRTQRRQHLVSLLAKCSPRNILPFFLLKKKKKNHSINSHNSPFSHPVLPVLSPPYWSFQLYISLWKSPSALI